MAILKLVSGEKVDLNDGDSLADAAESLGIPLACRAGVCGSCRVKIVSGMENLNDRSEEADMLGLEDNERLMCKASIKQGEVIIDPN
jgi:ferredoxin